MVQCRKCDCCVTRQLLRTCGRSGRARGEVVKLTHGIKMGVRIKTNYEVGGRKTKARATRNRRRAQLVTIKKNNRLHNPITGLCGAA